MNIQLQANAEDGFGNVEPVPVSQAEFFSLYQGEPGKYQWVADFAELSTARWIGKHIAQRIGHRYVENLIGDEDERL
jgi:hypothetical protein